MKTSCRSAFGEACGRARESPLAGERRRFLKLALGWAAGAGLLGARALPAAAFGTMKPERKDGVARFHLAQLRYAGDWDPHPGAAGPLLDELERMTSVEAGAERAVVTLGDPRLFEYPFLCVTGRRDFPPLAAAELERLRTWLEAGGTLLVDDAAATPGYGFDAAARREIARLFPAARPERLGAEHTIFKSFFLVRTVAGARIASPFLDGITLQGRTAVVFSPNDLLGAFARDPLGRWSDPCAPGGERQRRLAFQLAVNVVLYALCGDYKQDRIHVPFLRQRV